MSHPPPAQTSVKVAVIEAAERLIAEQGLGHVSHRDVAAAAGQRNVAVINYHFGGFDDLIVAILDLRMAQVKVRRQELWKKIPRAGVSNRVPSLAEAFILPLAEFVEEARGQSYYARFLAQLDVDPRGTPWEFAEGVLSGASLVDYQRFSGSLRDVLDGLREELKDRFCQNVLELRLHLSLKVVVSALAERERILANAALQDAKAVLSGDMFRNVLVDIYLGMLTSPDSTEFIG